MRNSVGGVRWGRRQAVWLVGLTVLGVGRGAAAPPSGGPPLPRATRVIAVGPDNSTGQAGLMGSVGQPWLSDHEVLHFRQGRLFRYDTTTHSDAPLAPLTRQVKSSHCYSYFLDVAPNGRQVIWGMSANNPLFVATVDGARRAQWDGDGSMTQPFWCSDGMHWMQFHFGGTPERLRLTKIQVHSLVAPRASETFPSAPSGLNGLDILAAPSADCVIARTPDPVQYETPKPSKIIKGPDGTESFIVEIKNATRSVQTISVWSLRRPQPLHRWRVSLPGLVQEVAVSPESDRAAWLLTSASAKKSKMASSLWVSGLDGSGLREIGVAKVTKAAFPFQVRWVPGGRRLSFLYGDALWTVPTEGTRPMPAPRSTP